MVDIQVFVQTIRIYQGVGHLDALGFHGVFFGELVLGDLLVVKVGDFVLHDVALRESEVFLLANGLFFN